MEMDGIASSCGLGASAGGVGGLSASSVGAGAGTSTAPCSPQSAHSSRAPAARYHSAISSSPIPTPSASSSTALSSSSTPQTAAPPCSLHATGYRIPRSSSQSLLSWLPRPVSHAWGFRIVEQMGMKISGDIIDSMDGWGRWGYESRSGGMGIRMLMREDGCEEWLNGCWKVDFSS